jgi:RNA polymerase sigma factor (sigma-70 family)
MPDSAASVCYRFGRFELQPDERRLLSYRIEVNEVFAQIGRLPVEQRAVLILAAVEEPRYDEIARLLGVPIGTVMSRLSRARERLRRMAGAPSSPL